MSDGANTESSKPVPQLGTIFVVDHDPDVRQSIAILARSANFDVELFASEKDFQDRHNYDPPACLILDVGMPGLTGVELQESLNAAGHRIPVIMVSGHAEVTLVTRVMRAGALDFIQKPLKPQALLDRMHEAIQLDAARHRSEDERTKTLARVKTLSPREYEVMALLAEGQSTKQIASELQISIKTVDNHRSNVLEKMALDNTAQLARLIARLG